VAILTPQDVKSLIPHTWPLFFARHGRFTPIQQQAIPTIGAGQDALLIAATASGKTEAALAPLLERHWAGLRRPGLRLLYLCPTRALVRDLYERLRPLLADTGIRLAMKMGDTGPLDTTRPPAILLTTPESTDSLLTRVPRLFTGVTAVILDEIHLFDNTPRGDHVRCLLERIERIRHYARPDATPAQRVALSATVPDPAEVAARYLHEGAIIAVTGSREIVAEIRPLYDLADLSQALSQRAAAKSLLFCNTRAEVEQTAVYLRQHLPHHADIFVHYSNLDAQLRQEVEARFAAAAVAICVATSTLELGIDIGSVDDVILRGCPPDLTAFLQRIGRGGRRTDRMAVLCLPQSPGEYARFEALLALAREEVVVADTAVYSFRPSVLVQQIFSLCKQNPTGGVRLADVVRLAPADFSANDVELIVRELAFNGYLRSGRLGEWKPDTKLQELLDEHEIYSNIGAEPLAAAAVDAYTGRLLAYTERPYNVGQVLLFGGRPMRVAWREKYRFGLAAAPDRPVEGSLRFQTARAAIPFGVTQAVARLLGLEPGQMAILPVVEGGYLFHFWGTVWGMLLTAVWQAQGIIAETINEYCLYLPQRLDQLPPWDEQLAARVARRQAPALADRLQMGRFHKLLPADVARTAVMQQLNLPQLAQTYQSAQITFAPHLAEQLHMLSSA
jgi:ATP-dependent helicase Lhr and Lhr-like helicase